MREALPQSPEAQALELFKGSLAPVPEGAAAVEEVLRLGGSHYVHRLILLTLAHPYGSLLVPSLPYGCLLIPIDPH